MLASPAGAPDMFWARTGGRETRSAVMGRMGPVLVLHGEADSMVPAQWGVLSGLGLKQAGLDVTIRTYRGLDHQLGEKEVGDLVAWINSVLPQNHPVVPQVQQGQASPATTAPVTTAGAARAPHATAPSAEDNDSDAFVPYRLRQGTRYHTAWFSVPKGWEEALSKYPINAREAQFELQPSRHAGVLQCSFMSADPDATARAIQARLLQRLQDPAPPGAENCVVM